MAKRWYESQLMPLLLILINLLGCQSAEPVYMTGFSDFADDYREVDPALATYFHSLRPLLPKTFRHDSIDNQPDHGQDYLALLLFSYQESSLTAQDMLAGRIGEELTRSQLIEGYPKFVIIEDSISQWQGNQLYLKADVKELDSEGLYYDQYRMDYKLSRYDLPLSVFQAIYPDKVYVKPCRGATIAFDNEHLKPYRTSINKLFEYTSHRAVFYESGGNFTRVYIFYGRIDGRSFGRVFINPNLNQEESSYQGFDPVVDSASVNQYGFDRDLGAFVEFLHAIESDYQSFLYRGVERSE